MLVLFVVGGLARQLEAATYHVGTGQTYTDLSALFAGVTLSDGDVIILYGDDASLKDRLVRLDGMSLTMRSNDPATPRVISMNTPSVPGRILDIRGRGTLVLSGVTFTNANGGSHGGAIFTGYQGGVLNFSGDGDYTFAENQASGVTERGNGGAVLGFGSMIFSGSGNYTFADNLATGTEGFGGAIYVYETLSFFGNGNYTFTENQTDGAKAWGGAIFANAPISFTGSGDYRFAGNVANGADVTNVIPDPKSGGGAIYAENRLSFSGSGNYTFAENLAGGTHGHGGAICAHDYLEFSGSGNYTFTGNQATGVRGHGGAIYMQGDLSVTGSGNYTFTDNLASGTEDWSGGGAIYVAGQSCDLSFFGSGNYTFTKNRADGANEYGGAIHSENTISFSGSGNYTFTENQAQGTQGYGGAIYVRANLDFSGSGDYLFIGNRSTHNGGAIFAPNNRSPWDHILSFSGNGNYTFIENQANSGGAIDTHTLNFSGSGKYLFMGNQTSGADGGAIYAYHTIDFSDNGDYVFIENRSAQNGGAIGGIVPSGGALNFSGTGNYVFVKNTADQSGGAIYAGTALVFSGHGNYTFTENQADSGGVIWASHLTLSGESKYVFTENQAASAGGALGIGEVLNIQTGATFKNNHATNGYGGAIYFGGIADGHSKITALNTPNGSVLFRDNTMNPDNTGAIPNSIYFAGTSIGTNTVAIEFHVADRAKFYMFDPMASGVGADVEITKTGVGTWVLTGHNDMRGSTHWEINEGKLFLIHDYYTKSAPHDYSKRITNIDLSHASDAEFLLTKDAVFVVDPGYIPHQITGQSITLEEGSTSEAAGFRYGPILPLGRHVLLTLHSDNVVNNQTPLQNADGIVIVGAYRYRYELFQWEDIYTLVFDMTRRTLDPERGGVPTMTAPGTVAFYNPAVDIVRRRGQDVLDPCRRYIRYCERHDDGLWATPAHVMARQSSGGDNTIGYKLDYSSVMVGYDRRNYRTFCGLGAAFGSPEFSAGRAWVQADDMTMLAYGGTRLGSTRALTGHIGGGHTRYHQFRQVEDESYAGNFSSRSFLVGAELSRARMVRRACFCFCIRTAIGYDFIGLWTEGLYEDAGEDVFFSLDMPSREQFLHRMKIGVELNWQPVRWFHASGDLYYTSVWGGRSSRATARFINDRLHTFETMGNPIDADHLGLGTRLTFPVNKNWEFGIGYTAMLGYKTTGQQATLTAVCKF